jgi:osmotically-inducible protein OsmY
LGAQRPGGYGGQSTGFSGGAQGFGQGGSSGGAYTGQTGSGYGQTYGGRQGAAQDQSWWNRAKDQMSSLFSSDDQPGQHRGRGPKSYSRSDERIRDDVNDRLTDDPFLDATHVEVAVEGGEVTLTGTVSQRGDKRRAEDLADNVSGVKHVQNNLRVGGVEGDQDQQGGAGRSA